MRPLLYGSRSCDSPVQQTLCNWRVVVFSLSLSRDDGGGRFSHFDQPYGGGGMHGGGPHGGAGWNDSQPGHFGNSQGVKGSAPFAINSCNSFLCNDFLLMLV